MTKTKNYRMEDSLNLGFSSYRKTQLASLCAVIAISAALGGYYVYQQAFFKPKISNDIPMHLNIALESARTGAWHSYTYYHKLIYFMAMGKPDMVWLSWASIILLALFVSLKAVVAYNVIDSSVSRPPLSATLAVASILVMPLFNWWYFPAVYLGQISPNVWHNPTSIISFPLAASLFFMMMRTLKTYSLKDFGILGALGVANVLTKPNYLLAFFPVFLAVLAYDSVVCRKVKVSSAVKGLLLFTVPVLILLLYQFFSTFKGDQAGGGTVVLMPFAVWRRFSPNIPASILLSLALPVAYHAAYPSSLRERRNLLCWAIVIVAILQFMLLAQSGPKIYDGNFIWGAIVATFPLFVITIAGLFSKDKTIRFHLVLLIFALHLISGITSYYRAVTLFIHPYHA